MVIEELVKTVLSELKAITKTETVVGNPITVGDTTIVPVSRVSVGFGVGGGRKDSKDGRGEATGGGISVEPVAFIVLKKGKVELVPMEKGGVSVGKIIDIIPHVMEKVKGVKERREEGKSRRSRSKGKNEETAGKKS